MPVVAARIAVPSNKPALDAALEGLTRLNEAIIEQRDQAGAPLPKPYESKVVWRPDGFKGGHKETWDTWDVCVSRGYGDCEDLAAATAAYLRREGIPARAVVQPSNSPGVAWHAVVELPDGRIMDPSAKMGMHEYHAQRRAAVRGRRNLVADLRAIAGTAERTRNPTAAALIRGLAAYAEKGL